MATKAELQLDLEKKKAEIEELRAQLARQEQREHFKKETDTIHDLYQSFIDSGFTAKQAWKLLQTAMHNAGMQAPPLARGGIVR